MISFKQTQYFCIRTDAGYTFFPENLAKNCPASCTFHPIDLYSTQYEQTFNCPDAQTCYARCLHHDFCKFFLWIPPEHGSQQYECWLKWGELGTLAPAAGELMKANYRDCSVTDGQLQLQRESSCFFRPVPGILLKFPDISRSIFFAYFLLLFF